MEASHYAILDLIPQRAPIVMVDRFVGIDDEGVSHSELTVCAENLFVDDGQMSECGLIEHIAQSAAARVGYLFREAGKEVPLGFIGSVNKLEVSRLPEVDDRIETSIRIVQEVFQVTLIEAQSCVSGKPIATCRMKIFLDI